MQIHTCKSEVSDIHQQVALLPGIIELGIEHSDFSKNRKVFLKQWSKTLRSVHCLLYKAPNPNGF